MLVSRPRRSRAATCGSASADGDVVHRRARDAARAQHLEPLRRRARAEDRLEHASSSSRLRSRRANVAKRSSVAQLGEPERARRDVPRAPASGRRRRASRRAVSKFWNGHHRLVRRVRAAHGLVAARGDPGADVVQLRERRLEQRQVDVPAAPVAPRAPDAGEDRDRGDVAAAEVDEREPALRRRVVRVAGDALPAREPLERVVVRALASPAARSRRSPTASSRRCVGLTCSRSS